MLLLLVANGVAMSAIAAADTPPVEDARAAIADRGIVFSVGKRKQLLVVVPPATTPPNSPAGTKLASAAVYFGDAKALYRQETTSNSTGPDGERLQVDDWRGLGAGELIRSGEAYSLACSSFVGDDLGDRTFPLASSSVSAASLARSAVIHEHLPGYRSHVLARATTGTTYYYVDAPRLPVGSKDFRLFIGKRGALKRVPIKEMALDSSAQVFVTAKGTLILQMPKSKNDELRVTFGASAKKQTELQRVPLWENRALVYRDLGVYTRDRTGMACEEL